MGFGVEGIAAASVDWSMYQVQSQYSTSLRPALHFVLNCRYIQ